MMKLWNRRRKAGQGAHHFCTAIVPAAGSSRRMGGENKLFSDLEGMPVLMRTLRAVDASELVDEIVVAAQSEMLLEVADLCRRADLKKSVRVVQRGASRTESVLAAAMEADSRAEYLAIHDGARPLVQPADFDEVIRYAYQTYAAAPAVPVTDTIKVADESGRIVRTPDRSTLRAVQTPQVFQANILKAALLRACEDGAAVTDDCAAVERFGKQVYLIGGNTENIKITTPVDLVIAAAILKKRGQ